MRAVPRSASSALCLACGLCCDGTLFGNVELQLADDEDQLKALGLPISSRGKPRFPQPCRALGADCRCAVYTDRPQQCRAFVCALLQAVESQDKTADAALRLIRRTRQQAERVRVLLRTLGDTDELRAMAKRFQKVRHRLETQPPEGLDRESQLDTLAELTLAVHELQFALRRHFYPDPADLASSAEGV